jgi:phosphoenolpyruvate synthase/pyruvate phosphate dikinase
MPLVTLDDEVDPQIYGAKAATLAVLRAAGESVPPGVVVRAESAPGAVALVQQGWERILGLGGARLAVRSSAVGEDGELTSFAGVFTSVTDVPTEKQPVAAAIDKVFDSETSEWAVTYLKSHDPGRSIQMAVLIQPMVVGALGGVIFTVNPVTGAAEFVIEIGASGVGDAVTGRAGDPITIPREGARDLAGTDMVSGLPPFMEDLLQTAVRCENHIGMPVDVEWVASPNHVAVVQCRPITGLEVRT